MTIGSKRSDTGYPRYTSVSEMKTIDLQVGGIVETESYYSGWAAANNQPAGGASYNIITLANYTAITGLGSVDGHGDHLLDNGNVAMLWDTNLTKNVMQYGTKADGATDDFSRITSANAMANIMDTTLFFPKGVYAFSLQVGASLIPTVSWESNGAELKNTNLALASDTVMVQLTSQDGLIMEGIVLNGQITKTGSSTPNEDQSSPSDSNINDYTRAAGWQLVGCTNITMKDCSTKNIYRASFRCDAESQNIKFINCSTTRNRGEFGDPFYSQYVRNVSYIGCSAYDYTRIAYVYEGNVGTGDGADFVSMENCYAEYAHDNISTENSCGYWVENASEVHITNCHALNTVGGFVLTSKSSTGKAIPNSGVLSTLRTFNMSDCTALSVKCGLHINPDNQVSTYNIVNFNGHVTSTAGSAQGTFAASTARDVVNVKVGSTDCVINLTNCTGYIDNAGYVAAESYGFLGVLQTGDSTTQKIINVVNCSLKFGNAALVRTDAASGNGKGFYHTIGSAGVEVHLENCSELGALNDAMSVAITSYDDKHSMYIKDCRPQFIKSSGDSKSLRIDNCEYVDCDVTVRSNIIKISNSDINLLNVNGNNIKLNACTVAQSVVTTDDPHTRYDGFKAVGCNFNGNLSAASTLLFTTADARAYRGIFTGCVFHNSAGATNTYEFIEFTTANGQIMGSGNIIDNRVTNYGNHNGTLLIAPKTDTDADMPFGIFQAIDA